MTLTLDMTLEIEAQLRKEATLEGLDEAGYILKTLKERFQAIGARVSRPEADLLSTINQGLPEETWQHYKELVKLRLAEELTPEQHAALIALTYEVEEAHVRRLQALAELARLRNTSIDEVMHELGIKFPPHA